MEQFLRQLQTIPEAAELIRRVEEGARIPEGGCPAAVSGLQPVQRACVGAAVAAACGRPAVFLCGDEREVQVLSADLETLTGRRPVTLLGREWQFRPGAVGSRDWERSRLAALYALALLLLILGVGNQGMRDVLVKAIQICTECIGLG